jgi:hypothetical protein
MVSTSSISSSARFIRVILAGAFVACVCVALRGERARACGGGWDPSIGELSTFDPDIEAVGLAYNPYDGGSCGSDDCQTHAMLADWRGYLKETGVGDADWKKVLFEASPGELVAIRQRLSGKATPAPKGYDQSSLWKVTAGKDKLLSAVAVVELVRKIEPFTGADQYDANGTQKPRGRPSADLLATARAGLKATKDPFLSQRYAFAAVRILFYQHDWNGLVTFFDTTEKVLVTPSADLAGRARYYMAGALARSGKFARANLELARVNANFPLLAGSAEIDFKPKEDKDWREALRLAKTVREKTELWRLVGLKKDGLVATQEILKLDPKSNLVGALLARELASTEGMVSDAYGQKPDPKDIAAQKKAYATIEQIAVAQASMKGADRPWIMELIAGHIAAKRGDVANARARLLRAVAARPGDVKVATQAKASLAVALTFDWKISPQNEDELAKAMGALDKDFSRSWAVRRVVREKLAKAYLKAGKIVDAEFLNPGTVDPIDSSTGKPASKLKPKWSDITFIKEMIARSGRTTTEFDRFVLKDSLVRAQLEQDLALRYMLDGDFAASAKTFQTTKATSDLLRTDPFVIHIIDCHDCDHTKYEKATWTHANFAAKLVELELKAKGGGESAADAALLLGNALYNISHYGNARIVLDFSHQSLHNASAAERWYKRAFELTKNRELKVKAAFMAAKSEQGTALGAIEDSRQYDDPMPLPKTWYPIVKQFADTKYYKEILRECGNFARWAKK